MFLANDDLVARWSGYSSLGAFLLDSEKNDRDSNATEHQILKELRQGKWVSRARLRKLLEAISRKWLSGQPLPPELEKALASWSDEEPDQARNDPPFDQVFGFWSLVQRGLPVEFCETRKLIAGLISQSRHLSNVLQEQGEDAVAVALSEMADRTENGPSQAKFLIKMAGWFKTGGGDAALAELGVYGTLLVVAIYVREVYAHDAIRHGHDQDGREFLRLCLAVENGRVQPKKAFAHWLEMLTDLTGYESDALLWDGFVVPVWTADELELKDKKNLLRNSRRYRSGKLVPSFEKARTCLHSISPRWSHEEMARWMSELENRQLALHFILLVTNSALYLKGSGADADRPCQVVYELFAKGPGE